MTTINGGQAAVPARQSRPDQAPMPLACHYPGPQRYVAGNQG
jgi:hypothetical protein